MLYIMFIEESCRAADHTQFLPQNRMNYMFFSFWRMVRVKTANNDAIQ